MVTAFHYCQFYYQQRVVKLFKAEPKNKFNSQISINSHLIKTKQIIYEDEFESNEGNNIKQLGNIIISIRQIMQGGMFGLSARQKYYLYICHLIPAFIAYMQFDLTIMMFQISIYYVLSSWTYIKFLSIQKNLFPFTVGQFSNIKLHAQKGMALAISGFLLITIYGVIFIKIGKVALPAQVNLGTKFNHNWWAFLILCLINPLLEQWYWRLFFPQAIQPKRNPGSSTEINSLFNNISYLLFHLVLFSKYVGLFRAVPLVGTFFSVGRSMTYIANKYSIISSIITHYGISLGGFALYLYLKTTTNIFK